MEFTQKNHKIHHTIRSYMHALDSNYLMNYQFPVTCKHTLVVILNGDKWAWSWSSKEVFLGYFNMLGKLIEK